MPALAPEHWVTIIASGLAMIGVVSAALLAALAGLLKARADRQVAVANLEAQQAVTKAQIDQQIDDRTLAELARLNGEVDELRVQLTTVQRQYTAWKAAVARVLHAIAEQWAGDGGPNIDPGDIAILEDTIPLRWMRPRRPSTAPITQTSKE